MKEYNQDLTCITWINLLIWEVWLHVASDKLEQLVKANYVHIPTAAHPKPSTIKEVVKELKKRLCPLDDTQHKPPLPHAKKCRCFQHQTSLGPSEMPSLVPEEFNSSAQ
eukprot:7537615-Ditylum_brightwellii.AAC.1